MAMSVAVPQGVTSLVSQDIQAVPPAPKVLDARVDARSKAEVELRSLQESDRVPLRDILQGTRMFTSEEVGVALELIDLGLRVRERGYRFLVAEIGCRVAGYACFGRAPCTDAVFELFWIAVDRQLHRRGVGGKLLDTVEASVCAEGGRMLLIETDSKPEYEATRRFYQRRGCRVVARIPDFYRPGDDKIVYAKHF